ncbi:cell death activator CIDE-A isoform X1 [Melanotaenia boesemani]|uniref:cell death activator CIDE-A isoform X1 n=1 Tax=Melanotaenia boesemani TaxID=1250792 RepID=UPI001C047FEA|nr:cell death activator CIDE-A isoform X1 [Melanotaenia boesemani]
MAPLSIQSGVNYAKTLLPETLMRSVSTVQTTISRRILPSSQPRCYRVCTHSRRRRRNLLASSLDELLEQAETVFMMSRYNFLTLVLEEDGAVVDSEEFFQSLPSNIPLMVLDKGEMWTENKILPSFREPKKSGIAKLTFDLYKVHPKDFLCCLAIRATLYEVYTLSYDLKCTRVKHVIKSVLRCVTCLTRLTGQLLLCTSSSLLQFTGGDEC